MIQLHRLSPEPRHVLRMYWRRKWLLVAVIVVIPAAVYGISKALPKTYEAATTLIVRQTGISATVFSDQSSFGTDTTADVARLLHTSAVSRSAAREVEGGELAPITTTFDEENLQSPFLTVTATSEDPERAAETANAYATVTTETRIRDAQREIDDALKEIRLRTEKINKNSAGAAELATQLQRLEGLRAAQDSLTQVLEPAEIPDSPVSPRPRHNTLLAMVFSLLIAAGLGPALDWLNRRIRDEADLDQLVDGPVLASIPRAAYPGAGPDSFAVKEAFQTLRASLLYFNVDRRDLDLILVTSPSHQEGKTTVSTNLATSLAQDGQDVVLIDGDMRRPRVADRLGAERSMGLEQVLVDDVDIETALEQIELDGAGNGRLRVLAHREPAENPSVLLGSRKFHRLLEALRADADIIIIDTPPILAVADAIPVMGLVGGVLLIAKMDSTTMEEANRAIEVIDAAGGHIVGTVLTGVEGLGAYGYGYGYGYGGESAGRGDGQAIDSRSPSDETAERQS